MRSLSSYDYQDDLLSISSSSSSSSRRFYRLTSLGRPPGLPKLATFPTSPSNPGSYDQQQQSLSTYSNSSYHNNHNKTAPFKEVEKMIADLKKENFDLKLRLFHMNWLEQENERLSLALEEIGHDKQEQQEEKTPSIPARSIGTQTLFVDISHSIPVETLPEAFELTPYRTTRVLSSVDNESSNNNNNVEHVADAFSNVRIDVPSPINPIRGWLENTQSPTNTISSNGSFNHSHSDNVSPLSYHQQE
ncbi:hypothetical protein INT45_013985 [Circinella minor]|uniref:Centrosomin N-terminal motif 1 domain-containing protein n=1 Tax=Circinella minor TaxID=1195481 RepID=A0A8H7RYJ9_9FUNG|nr:hypothetical protein INT45_013985 [Circinella minor]